MDYISAFNTFIPKKLFNKLSAFDLSQSVCFYIADFLVYRPQKIRVKDGLSNILVLITDALQDCVRSPFLYCLFTN